MLCTSTSKNEGSKLAMFIQDNQVKKGVIKRLIFNPADSTWLMLMAINKIKQGTLVHKASMFRDSLFTNNLRLIKTKNKKTIEGYNCIKYIINDDKYSTELWVAKSLNYNVSKMYSLLRHCGMISDFSKTGNWYKKNEIEGMILEVNSVDKHTNTSYSIKISEIKQGVVLNDYFDTSNFKISEIPEGQNCGVVIDDDKN